MMEKKQMLCLFRKNKKQSINNYKPVFFLPICGKIIEMLLYNEMFSFFIENGSKSIMF